MARICEADSGAYLEEHAESVFAKLTASRTFIKHRTTIIGCIYRPTQLWAQPFVDSVVY